MGKVLIIKTGSILDVVKQEYGDFEDLILSQIGIGKESANIISVFKNEPPYLPEGTSSIIITGSKAMITDEEPWMKVTAAWIRSIDHSNIPILGICFGHQLLAYTYGGKVGYHPEGPEYGQSRIRKVGNEHSDPIFRELPEEFSGYVAHYQSVLQLPEHACVLAANDFEASHGVKFKNNIWGMQFHPEFNAKIAYHYLKYQEEVLIRRGYRMDQLYEQIQEVEYGKQILQRFYQYGEQLR